MKKSFALTLIVALLFVAACKKAEEKPQPESTSEVKTTQPRPPRAKKKKPVVVAPLEIYNEDKLVTSVPPDQYPTLGVTKIKVGKKEVSGVLLSDLLKKHNLKGKTVILSGRGKNAQLTWEQATANKVYVYITPRKTLQFADVDKNIKGMRIPALEKITVTQKVETAAANAGKKPET
jgi:hypothetical protein